MYKTYYICHHCANYITFNKSDIVKHYNKLSKCDSINQYTYEDAYHLSLERKFYLNKDELHKDNLVDLVLNYSELDINTKKKEIKNLNKIKKLKEISEKIFFIKDKNKYKCTDCLCEFTTKKDINEHLLNQSNCEKVKSDENNTNKNTYKKIIKNSYNNIIHKCISENISLQDLELIINNYLDEKKI
jgi:hypothetical protein